MTNITIFVVGIFRYTNSKNRYIEYKNKYIDHFAKYFFFFLKRNIKFMGLSLLNGITRNLIIKSCLLDNHQFICVFPYKYQ